MMVVKIVNAFVEAAHEVLLSEAALHTTRGDLNLTEAALTTEDITVIIGLVGNITGSVIYSFTEPIALDILGRMMGEPVSKIDNLAQSGLAELGNVITGRASIKLEKIGCEIKISPPMLLVGHGTALSTLDLPRLSAPLHTETGTIGLHLAVREASHWSSQLNS